MDKFLPHEVGIRGQGSNQWKERRRHPCAASFLLNGFVDASPLLVGQSVTVRLLHRQWHSVLRASDFTDGVARYLTDVVDEKVAELHLSKLGAKLTQLTKPQADYIGVPPNGPFKSEHYRY